MPVKTVAGPCVSWFPYLGFTLSLSPRVFWEATRSIIVFPVQRVGRTNELWGDSQ